MRSRFLNVTEGGECCLNRGGAGVLVTNSRTGPANAIRVVFVSVDYPPAVTGVGDYLYQLVRALKYTTTVHPFVVTASSSSPQGGCTDPLVDRLPDAWHIRDLPFLTRRILAKRPHLVHFQHQNREFRRYGIGNLLPLVLRTVAPHVRLVHTLHDPLMSLTWRGRVRTSLGLAGCAAVVAVDERCAQLPLLARRLTATAVEVQEIPPASAIPAVRLTATGRESVRRNLRLGATDTMLCYFGFLTPRKGFEVLLDVLHRTPEHVNLVFIGEFETGNPYHEQLQQRITTLGLGARLRVTGSAPAEYVAAILAASDACVFPFTEGVSLRNTSYLAARLQGTFIVTTSLGKQGYAAAENTWYVRPSDTNAILQALDKHAGDRIRPDLSTLPSWQHIATRHLHLYQRLVCSPPPVLRRPG